MAYCAGMVCSRHFGTLSPAYDDSTTSNDIASRVGWYEGFSGKVVKGKRFGAVFEPLRGYRNKLENAS
jgi:hypothetical protein